MPASESPSATVQSPPNFVSAAADFPRSEKNLRKWEAATVADLDQDGWPDLILNEHGFALQVMWNNRGKFAPPWDLVMGDLHGVTVGDLDRDGRLELVVSRGGGSGSNARNSMIYRIEGREAFTRLPEFPEPLAMMRGRTVKLFDGDRDGDLDLLNLAFPSNNREAASENYVYRNEGNGTLELDHRLERSYQDGQKILLTDFDNDGVEDVLMYGHRALRAFRGKGDLSFTEISEEMFPTPIEDVTGVVEIDFDNDGDFDIFLSRGRDFEAGSAFYDAKTDVWGFFAKRGKFRFDDFLAGDVLDLENYQSPWPNKKIYTGEPALDYAFPGETHSGKDVRFVNSDTLGWPDQLPNKGLYVGYVGNGRWRVAGETWSPLTAVFRGVKSGPQKGDTLGPTDVLLENRDGRFFDITERVGISGETHSTDVSAADFNNDGHVDLIVVQRGQLVTANESTLWLNRGNGTFERSAVHGVISPELGAIGMGVSTFDYNQDGLMDIIVGNERGKWHLFRNNTDASANHAVVDLRSILEARRSILGAVVSLTAGEQTWVKRCGMGGSPYSRGHDPYVHFGLGDYQGPVSVTVSLSDGTALTQEFARAGKTVSLDFE
ncbi:MAG: hypothetical protein SynsKO_30570 [Synoicihabitans sp.]